MSHRLLVVFVFGAGCGRLPVVHDNTGKRAAIFCEAETRCCGSTTSMMDCINEALDRHANFDTDIQFHIDHGDFVYHADVAESCLSALRSSYANCDADSSSIPLDWAVCNSAVTGSLGAGAQCIDGVGCAQGLFCTLDATCLTSSQSALLDASVTCTDCLQCKSGLCVAGTTGGTCSATGTVRQYLCGGDCLPPR